MKRLLTTLGRFATGNHGQDLMEYGLLAALIAVVVVAGVTVVGGHIYTTFWQVIGNAV